MSQMEVWPTPCCSPGRHAEFSRDEEGARSPPKRQRELAGMAQSWALRLIPKRKAAGRWSRRTSAGKRSKRGCPEREGGLRKVGTQKVTP